MRELIEAANALSSVETYVYASHDKRKTQYAYFRRMRVLEVELVRQNSDTLQWTNTDLQFFALSPDYALRAKLVVGGVQGGFKTPKHDVRGVAAEGSWVVSGPAILDHPMGVSSMVMRIRDGQVSPGRQGAWSLRIQL